MYDLIVNSLYHRVLCQLCGFVDDIDNYSHVCPCCEENMVLEIIESKLISGDYIDPPTEIKSN